MTKLYPFRLQIPAEASPEGVSYPALIRPWLDGSRWTVIGNVLRDEELKPVKVPDLQEVLGRPEFEGLEGVCTSVALPWEAMEGKSAEGEWRFYVCDDHSDEDASFRARLDGVRSRLDGLPQSWEPEGFFFLEGLHSWVENPTELKHYLYIIKKNGYEAAALLDPRAPYRRGGSPGEDGWFLKVGA